ncbi:hypothetical protein BRC86_07215 [Halobacteriales archaeon QS_3_64_16]|nr:MAG: hypothetical protein BRC86_07215 [Halobacteriales archaeon QS_3_64_16]
MPKLSDVTSFERDLPSELRADLEKYTNQGGLLGVFTYFFTYLETDDEDLAATAASIPTCLFVMSSLHDDAIDEAIEQEEDLKGFLNWRTTVGDVIFTYAIDFAEELPEGFDVGTITGRFREIGAGQLREESLTTTDLTVEQAITRVEERGSVWGELAVGPVEAAGYYSEARLERIYTFTANLLFVLTVIDDVEDLPEDLGNDVLNVPLLLYRGDPTEHASTRALIDSVLDSDVPARLDELITEHEDEMEAAARQFAADSRHETSDLLDAWNRSLVWYLDAACTVPVERNVPEERQEAIRSKLGGDDETKRRYLLEEIVAEFPARFDSREEFAASMSSLPATSLVPAAIKTFHIEALVDSVMTTSLEDALANLRAESTTAD